MVIAQQELESHGLRELGGLAPATVDRVKALLKSPERGVQGILTQASMPGSGCCVCLSLTLDRASS